MGIVCCSAIKMVGIQMCVLLLCFLTLALERSESEIVKLRSPGSVTSHCNERTTMYCNITSQHKLSIRLFVWMGPNGTPMCELDKNGEINVTSSGVSCDFRDKQLVLTIQRTKPIHQGEYLCKLRSTVGTKHSTSQLHIQECDHRLHVHSHRGNVTCRAKGVYPEAHIHWLQGSRNLTQSSVAYSSTQAKDGTYDISSTLHHTSQAALNCSLWSPSSGRYLSSTQAHPETIPPQPQGSSSRAGSVRAAGIVVLFAATLFLF